MLHCKMPLIPAPLASQVRAMSQQQKRDITIERRQNIPVLIYEEDTSSLSLEKSLERDDDGKKC